MKKILLVVWFAALASASICFGQKQRFPSKASLDRGLEIYSAQCQACHMENGEGIEDVYPPLAKSDYLMDDKERSIRQVIDGLSGEIKVNGKMYNGFMSGFDLTDEQVSDVLNFIRNSWGNKGGVVSPEEVAATKKK